MTLDEHLHNVLAIRQSMGDELYRVQRKKVTEEKKESKDKSKRH